MSCVVPNYSSGFSSNDKHFIGSWLWDLARDRVHADDVVARLFSVAAAEAADGLPLDAYLDAVHPQHRARIRAALACSLETHQPYCETFPVQPSGGQRQMVVANGKCIFNADGAPILFAGILVALPPAAETRAAALECMADLCSDAFEMAQGHSFDLICRFLRPALLEIGHELAALDAARSDAAHQLTCAR